MRDAGLANPFLGFLHTSLASPPHTYGGATCSGGLRPSPMPPRASSPLSSTHLWRRGPGERRFSPTHPVLKLSQPRVPSLFQPFSLSAFQRFEHFPSLFSPSAFQRFSVSDTLPPNFLPAPTTHRATADMPAIAQRENPIIQPHHLFCCQFTQIGPSSRELVTSPPTYCGTSPRFRPDVHHQRTRPCPQRPLWCLAGRRYPFLRLLGWIFLH